jgi:hypothetical protein
VNALKCVSVTSFYSNEPYCAEVSKVTDEHENLASDHQVEHIVQEVGQVLRGHVDDSSVPQIQDLLARLEDGKKELERLQAARSLRLAKTDQETRKLKDELEQIRTECAAQHLSTEQQLLELRANFRGYLSSVHTCSQY